jgi:dienelactone hydrolase
MLGTARLALSFVLASSGGITVLAAQADAPAAPTPQTLAGLLKIPFEAPAVQVTLHSTHTEQGLRIQDISWESLDRERVPAFVIAPESGHAETGSRPRPAIICLHGSGGSRESMITPAFGPGFWTTYGAPKPHTRMLGWARELARRGYLVLALTQRGLDRRTPPINQQSNVLLVHSRTGMGAVLYEIRQAVTYLASRPDVEAARIGATGMSFGGITAFYTWVLDPRIAAAAPICGGVGSVDQFAATGSIGYHGTYWWIPNMLAAGDQAAFAANAAASRSGSAPKPLMLWAPTEDIGMPKSGVDVFRAQLQPIYEKAGRPNHLRIHQPPGEHAFTNEAFEAMATFFAEHFAPTPPTAQPAVPRP